MQAQAAQKNNYSKIHLLKSTSLQVSTVAKKQSYCIASYLFVKQKTQRIRHAKSTEVVCVY